MDVVRRLGRLVSRLTLGLALLKALNGHAVAHVKWFCGPIDVNSPPLGPRAVLSPMFWMHGAAFLMLVAAGGLVDDLASGRWPRRLWQSRHLETVEALLIRLGVGLYALSLWDKVAVAPWGSPGEGSILTPELFDHDHWIRLLQIAIALMLLLRLTCPIAAAGLVAVYAIGVARYGIFHMTDYAYFLGLAGYLGLSGPGFDRRPEIRRWRVPLITASLSFSLMWTAMEKFLFPLWTGIVLVSYPNLTLGLPIPFVTGIAAFIEFSLAFYLLVGRSLLRLDALLLMVIFLAAIPEFGTLDSVGHIPIVAILLVVAIHGPTQLQEAAHPRRAGSVRAAASIAGLYVLVFVAMMAMYYGLQKAGTWP